MIGAFLMMGLVMALVMAMFELYIFKNFNPSKFKEDQYNRFTRPIMRKVFNLGPWIEKSALNSLIFSFFLSLVIGMIFPVAGFVAFMGGVGSTLFIQPYYAFHRKVMRHKARKAAGETFTQRTKSSFKESKDSIDERIRRWAES